MFCSSRVNIITLQVHAIMLTRIIVGIATFFLDVLRWRRSKTLTSQPNNVAPSTYKTQQPSRSASSTSPLQMTLGHVWEFQEDDGDWLEFVKSQQVELEDAYNKNKSELFFPPRDGE